MVLAEKERLARIADTSQEATAIRLRAARIVTGMSQKDFAAAAGTGKTNLNNVELGRQYPNISVMRYLYRAHRIDFNFILHGDFAQLPSDLQANLFLALEEATSEWDRRERSGSTRAKSMRETQKD
ncbi:helix-turn-helix transcriptional regulator [Thioclava sp. BHET1]|nr:helix-turn-helix transcriptional regulator [Thioclava sp. BHET1]